MSADSVPSSKTNIFQSKIIYCRHFRTYSRCTMFDWSDTIFRQRNVLQPRYWGREADSPEVCRLTMEPYLTNPGKKLDWPSKDTFWNLRESKIDLRLRWQSVLGTDCRRYICKIVWIRGTCKMRNETRNETKWNEIHRNETNFTETKRNRYETKLTETKRNNTKWNKNLF
jgi:hypothetical protein